MNLCSFQEAVEKICIPEKMVRYYNIMSETGQRILKCPLAVYQRGREKCYDKARTKPHRLI